MGYPQWFLDKCREMVDRQPDDIDKAAKDNLGWLRAHPDYDTVRTMLEIGGMRGVMCDIRHADTRKIKREANAYSVPPKVNVARSPDVAEIGAKLYEIRIASTRLGSLLGEQLAALATDERAKADGHLLNARLLELLKPLVPAGKTVRDCVPPNKLYQLFKRASNEYPAALAGD